MASAKDGLVAVGCATAQQWSGFCAMTGHPERIDQTFALSNAAPANRVSTDISGWTSSHAVDEIRALATAFRIPNALVGNGANLPFLDHFEARQTFVPNPRDGFTQPGHPYRNPLEPYSIGDPDAGVHAVNALMPALAHRRWTGAGAFVKAAMVDAALNVAAEQVIAYSVYGALLAAAGNRGPAAAPRNLYATAELDEFHRVDSRVAIAMAGDEQWSALCGAIGSPDWAADPKLSTMAGRRAHHGNIDKHLAVWCQTRTSGQVIELLWTAGVQVGKVTQPHRRAELPQLLFRGFFEEVEHPVNGRVRQSTLPFRLSHRPDRYHVSPAPLLGQHNHELLTALGLSERDIAELAAQGVIGTTSYSSRSGSRQRRRRCARAAGRTRIPSSGSSSWTPPSGCSPSAGCMPCRTGGSRRRPGRATPPSSATTSARRPTLHGP